MAYREISLPALGESTCTFEYVIGRWKTKIKGIGVFDNGDIGSTVGNPADEKIAVTPKDIQRAILRSDKCPPHVRKARDWDVPPFPGKKVDPGPRTRGFISLIGTEIGAVTLDAQNKIILHGTDGSSYKIDAYMADRGEPILTHCTQIGLSDPVYD